MMKITFTLVATFWMSFSPSSVHAESFRYQFSELCCLGVAAGPAQKIDKSERYIGLKAKPSRSSRGKGAVNWQIYLGESSDTVRSNMFRGVGASATFTSSYLREMSSRARQRIFYISYDYAFAAYRRVGSNQYVDDLSARFSRKDSPNYTMNCFAKK